MRSAQCREAILAIFVALGAGAGPACTSASSSGDAGMQGSGGLGGSSAGAGGRDGMAGAGAGGAAAPDAGGSAGQGGGGGGGANGDAGQGGAGGAATCSTAPVVPCSNGESCDLDTPNRCGAGSEPGHCIVLPASCIALVAPVCGCDGQTYGNDCERQRALSQLSHTGPCP
jgi:hypothetical protein